MHIKYTKINYTLKTMKNLQIVLNFKYSTRLTIASQRNNTGNGFEPRDAGSTTIRIETVFIHWTDD